MRNGAIGAILKNYEVLCKTLNEISEGGRDEYALKATAYNGEIFYVFWIKTWISDL